MNTTIHNSGLPKFTPATGSSGNGSAAAATSASASSSGGVAKADDQLKLTDSALALQQAARADTGSMNTQRVEQIRAALANGSYQINPTNIADRMLSMEQQIGGAGKI